MKKKLLTLPLLIALALVLSACTTTQPALPTPAVPDITQINANYSNWQNNNWVSYFLEVEENTPEVHRQLRIIIQDGEVRNAQALTFESGEWVNPQPITPEEAERYTIDAIFERIRQDALSQGPAPVNLTVIFDPTEGYPSVVDAKGAATYNEQGEMVLNRQYNYLYSITVDVLLEEIFGVGQEPVLTYTRLGGPDAECDKLRIYENRTSVYSNECKRLLLQLNPPITLMEDLNTLLAGFGPSEFVLEMENGSYQLTVNGTGSGDPETEAQLAILELADELMGLLSRPIGEGLTMIFNSGDEVLGLNMRSLISQPATIELTGSFYGGFVTADSSALVYSDDYGVKSIDLASGDVAQLLQTPADSSHFAPVDISPDNTILLNLVPADAGDSGRLGWITPTRRTFVPLPLPEGANSYDCSTGADINPATGLVAISGAGYSEDCSQQSGLILVDIEADTAEMAVAVEIPSGEEGVQLTAGTYTPAWSPNGELIAFGMDSGEVEPMVFTSQLYLAQADGSGITAITDNAAGAASHPMWATDEVLYYALNGVSEEQDGIYRYNHSTQEHTQILALIGLTPVSVSPTLDYMIFLEEDGDIKAFIFSYSEIIPVTSNAAQVPAGFVGWMLAGSE